MNANERRTPWQQQPSGPLSLLRQGFQDTGLGLLREHLTVRPDNEVVKGQTRGRIPKPQLPQTQNSCHFRAGGTSRGHGAQPSHFTDEGTDSSFYKDLPVRFFPTGHSLPSASAHSQCLSGCPFCSLCLQGQGGALLGGFSPLGPRGCRWVRAQGWEW